jgi:eukaryotic-like serine/threonine-protein kinase
VAATRDLVVASLTAVPQPATTSCPAEDELLAIARAGSLADEPAVEAHLADCATCSSLLAAVVERSSTPAWNALAGSELGPYRLESQIGAGGMGAVYRAHDTRLDRTIAIKILHSETNASRLATEARAAAAIGHPAIVAIHDVGSAAGVTYVAMELVEGESLRSVIERGPATRARELAIELVDALAAAHARGVIHRDLKPENLVIARDGRLRVLDFGLAKLADADPLDATEPGTVQGTAGYMAPEQARGEPADARADLFAAGAIMYELATGRRAFAGATHADRLTAVLRDTPAATELGVLAPIALRCLAKDPAERFHSAADLGWALRHAAAPPAARPRLSRRTWLAGVGAALAAGVGGFLLGRRDTSASATRAEFRQLTYKTGRVYSARFTADGHRLAFGAAWDADPVRVYVKDLAAGSTSRTETAGDALALSRRGDLAVGLARRFTNHQSATGTLALVPLAGGTPRVLASSIQEADFLPDGTLAIIRATSAGFTLEAPIGTPLVTSAAWITHPRVSPDGRRIAYLQHPNVNDDAGDVMVVDIASRSSRVLAAGWSSVAGLAWSGDAIWFTAGRDNGINVLHLARLDGKLRTIAETTGRLRLHDLTADRRAAVTVDTWRLRSLAGGTGLADRDCSLSEASFVVDISRVGTTLVIGELGSPETANGVYLTPVDGGSPLRLGDGFPLAISPSGQRVAANVMSAAGAQLVVYSTANGEHVALQAPGHVSSARWIDETTLVASSNQRLWRLAIGEAPAALTELGIAGRLAIDPIGRRCAVVDPNDRLHVVELATGADRVVAANVARRFACGWLADRDSILLATATTPLELARIDPITGAEQPFTTLSPPPVGLKAVDSLVVHAQGTRYAYSYGQELSQLYLMTLATA